MTRASPGKPGRNSGEKSRAAREQRGTLPIFLSDVKARHDKMGGLVETMLKLHGHP
jgi:hypothetical protein